MTKSKLRRHIESPIIKCECGKCDETFHNISRYGDRIRFIKGHQNRCGVGHNSKGGQVTTNDGRIKIYVPNHPYSDYNGYIFRYRLIIERHLNRYLNPNEIIHHINNIKTDDRLENLSILSPSQHTVLHNKKKDMSDRSCSYCGSKTTYISKKGYICWYKDGHNVYHCVKCHHKKLKLERIQ